MPSPREWKGWAVVDEAGNVLENIRNQTSITKGDSMSETASVDRKHVQSILEDASSTLYDAEDLASRISSSIDGPSPKVDSAENSKPSGIYGYTQDINQRLEALKRMLSAIHGSLGDTE